MSTEKQPEANVAPPATIQTQQPTSGPTMSVSGGNRNAKNLPINNEGKRDWSFGLFDCFDEPEKCLISCFCPCIVYGQIKARVKSLDESGQPHPDPLPTVEEDCLIYAALNACAGVGVLLNLGNRSAVQNRYGIQRPPDDVSTIFTVCCCVPCDLTQLSREIELEEQSLGMHKRSM